jgi:uncharacterized protein with GYD domain
MQKANAHGIIHSGGKGKSPLRPKREEGGRALMPTYISLANWTEQGISDVKQTLERADQSAQLAQKHGCTLERLFWTVGPYDLVAIVEAPDEESAMAYALEVGSSGGVRTTTLPAYDHEAMSRVVQRLG